MSEEQGLFPNNPNGVPGTVSNSVVGGNQTPQNINFDDFQKNIMNGVGKLIDDKLTSFNKPQNPPTPSTNIDDVKSQYWNSVEKKAYLDKIEAEKSAEIKENREVERKITNYGFYKSITGAESYNKLSLKEQTQFMKEATIKQAFKDSFEKGEFKEEMLKEPTFLNIRFEDAVKKLEASNNSSGDYDSMLKGSPLSESAMERYWQEQSWQYQMAKQKKTA